MPIGFLYRVARVTFWVLLSSIFVLALLPSPGLLPGSDKVQHAFAFFGLAASAAFAWPDRLARNGLYLLAVGALIEALQGILSVGQMSYFDMLANLAGVVLGITCARLISARLSSGDPAAISRKCE